MSGENPPETKPIIDVANPNAAGDGNVKNDNVKEVGKKVKSCVRRLHSPTDNLFSLRYSQLRHGHGRQRPEDLSDDYE